jgi:hypothetical protein
MNRNQAPLFPKRIRKATEYPDVTKVAIDDPKYTLRENSLLVPYDKAPDHPQYKKMALTVGETFYSVDRNSFKLNGILTRMPNGVYIAWTSCGMCHSHYTNCSCRSGLTCARSIEFIYDKTVAEMKGEVFQYGHPNYLGSVLDKARRSGAGLNWVNTSPARPVEPLAKPLGTETPPRPPKRLRKAAEARSEAPVGKRLRKAQPETAHRLLKGNRLDHKAADEAAAGHADALTNAVNKMLDSAPRKRIRKAGST